MELCNKIACALFIEQSYSLIFLYIELLQCHLMRRSYEVLWIIVQHFKPLTFFHIELYLILSVIQVEKQKTMSLSYAILN